MGGIYGDILEGVHQMEVIVLLIYLHEWLLPVITVGIKRVPLAYSTLYTLHSTLSERRSYQTIRSYCLLA